MAVTFRRVETPEQQAQLAEMAAVIWNEYWPPIIGQDQVDYMVRNFQSLEAIQRDVAEHGYEYWFVWSDAETARVGAAPCEPHIVGYTGGHDEPETDRFFISKIYLFADERGKGYASEVLRFYEDLTRDRGFRAMYLTVNKYNDMAVRAYVGKGFVTIDAVETDIGSGFIMDDFIMEKTV